MIKKYISIQRTARYFLSKELDKKVKKVIFVFHGYAQNADDFLESCIELSSEEILIVAPEGLSKFYWKDFSSKPSSSWMTSLERENEIKDIMSYLNQVTWEVLGDKHAQDLSISVLGFSQGAATASRFAAFTELEIDNLYLYGGSFAHDIDWTKLSSKIKLHFIYGDEDAFINEEQVNLAKNFVHEKGLQFEIFKFHGKHKIEKEALSFILRTLA